MFPSCSLDFKLILEKKIMYFEPFLKYICTFWNITTTVVTAI